MPSKGQGDSFPFFFLLALGLVSFSSLENSVRSSPAAQTFIRTNVSRPVALSPSSGAAAAAGEHTRHRDKETLVHIKSGALKGVKRSVLGKEVYVYQGVPFAKPPVGHLRFKKPLPNDPWHGIFNAVNSPNSCYQERYESFEGFRGEEMWNPNTNLSEDCLYLNLWAPKAAVRSAANGADVKPMALPVLMWIYGGGYMAGTNTLDIYNADILAAENDVIVVTINYRVGAFGFLYFGNDEAPGNMGLYDQVLAMKWVKENIKHFGGDPDSLTLFGESAGGGSVSLHLLSPISRHLITRGIIQSGTINAPWSILEAPQAKKNAFDLVNFVECNDTSKSEKELIDCLREVPANILSAQQWNSYNVILGFPSAPTIDGIFLPRHPIQMLKDGDYKKTELLIGSNKNEGTYFVLYDFMNDFRKDGNTNCFKRDRFVDIINQIFNDTMPHSSHTQLEREAILFQYTQWDDFRNECKNGDIVNEVVADYFFICPSNLFAELYAEQNDVYYYYFTQRTSSNPWGEWMGVLHADEIEYVFGHPLNNSRGHTLSEQDLSRRIMRYFTNFARTGKPVEEDEDWPPYTRSNPQYYILNAEETGKGTGPRAQACAFWNNFMPLIKPVPSECDLFNINSGISFMRWSWLLLSTVLLGLITQLGGTFLLLRPEFRGSEAAGKFRRNLKSTQFLTALSPSS